MEKDETVSVSKEPYFALQLFFIWVTNSVSKKTTYNGVNYTASGYNFVFIWTDHYI